MALAFTRIGFTPSVHAAQVRMGSRDAYRAAELGEPENVELGALEIDYIRARDSFYQGTVGDNGWPYVQHRGGPAGFLKVLDARTIGYADFSGNRQYISVGNLVGDNRVSLFLMDYPGQRRLKLWGRARLVDEDSEPELIARLESANYRAPVERGVLITIEAYDWNCPKHITPRFTERELAARASGTGHMPVQHAQQLQPGEEIGAGPLKLVVSGIRQLTPRVRAYELRARDGSSLPAVTAGAHLPIPVKLPNGSTATRQYSLTSVPGRGEAFEIAVLREEAGRGASAAIHASWQIGTMLATQPPANQFALHADDRPAVLIAGGIGITPIKAMAQPLKARGNPFELHYTGRRPADMAYLDALMREMPGRVHTYFTQTVDGKRIDLAAVIRPAPTDALIYVCGPAGLIEDARRVARKLNLPPERLRYENFE
ncbi:MAG: pyridoxamine 5'-phosphate oxidase [Betaproteobacteria bacterium]|nr:pyridoxamine 5'-phosphate oxidase [Betaproteobacteria bacterium]